MMMMLTQMMLSKFALDDCRVHVLYTMYSTVKKSTWLVTLFSVGLLSYV